MYCGCCHGEEYSVTVMANTAKEALGMCLEFNTDSQSSEWEIEEVDTTEQGVTRVY